MQVNSSDIPEHLAMGNLVPGHKEIDRYEKQEDVPEADPKMANKYFEVSKDLVLEIWRKYHRKVKKEQ